MTIQEQATPEPTTPQEWNQAALEALGWTKCEARDCWLSPGGVHIDCDEEAFPDFHSVDACLKHIVPVMEKAGYEFHLHRRSGMASATFEDWDAEPANLFEANDPDLALAIVKAFVRAMRSKQ